MQKKVAYTEVMNTMHDLTVVNQNINILEIGQLNSVTLYTIVFLLFANKVYMAVFEKITIAVTVSLDCTVLSTTVWQRQQVLASHKQQNFNPYLAALLGIYCLKLHPLDTVSSNICKFVKMYQWIESTRFVANVIFI